MSPIVELQRHGDIAVIVVDSPPVNTITAAARAGMTDAMKQVAADASVRAVLLRTARQQLLHRRRHQRVLRAAQGGGIPRAVGALREPEGADDRRHARLGDRRRARAGAGLPLPHRDTDGEVHAARGHAGHHSRRRRHPAAAAAHRARQCAAHDLRRQAGRRAQGARARAHRRHHRRRLRRRARCATRRISWPAARARDRTSARSVDASEITPEFKDRWYARSAAHVSRIAPRR